MRVTCYTYNDIYKNLLKIGQDYEVVDEADKYYRVMINDRKVIVPKEFFTYEGNVKPKQKGHPMYSLVKIQERFYYANKEQREALIKEAQDNIEASNYTQWEKDKLLKSMKELKEISDFMT